MPVTPVLLLGGTLHGEYCAIPPDSVGAVHIVVPDGPDLDSSMRHVETYWPTSIAAGGKVRPVLVLAGNANARQVRELLAETLIGQWVAAEPPKPARLPVTDPEVVRSLIGTSE